MGARPRDDYNPPVATNDDSGRPTKTPDKDMVFVYGQREGDAYSVLRRRGENVELGAIAKLEEGKPIHGEVVRLNRRDEHPLLFDVDVVADTQAVAGRGGPPQVATEAHRENWEEIFGKRKDRQL